jgi:hypothetical protein
MTIELDPQLHLRRAYQKIDQEKADGTFPLDSDDEQNKSEKERTAASTETVHRLADALVMLGQGVAVGGGFFYCPPEEFIFNPIIFIYFVLWAIFAWIHLFSVS